MQFSELIKTRYSVRAYKPDNVEQDTLNAVLNAANLAPTAANRQPIRIIVAKTENRQQELNRVYHRDWFVQAPLVICACAVPGEAWTRKFDESNYAVVDATIAMDHLILAAAEQGLGTCWIAAFDPKAARDVFDIPEDWEPVALTPLGYPADAPKEKKRKSLDEIVTFID